jgi:DNA-directed RNA polymerase subunit M/transcription elongation factor TFIIS
MKNFCDNCNNLLDINTTNDKLTFKCMTCYSEYKSEANDTLRWEETKGGNLLVFKTILNEAVNDSVNLKEYVPCPKCNHNLAKSVRLGSELRLIHICMKCKFQWIAV